MQTLRGFIFLTVVPLLIILATNAVSGGEPPKQARNPDMRQIERGRYLIKIAGCNDCHTPGYIEKAGNVPEKEWLTGNRVGWRGPWGTTYPSNLRIFISGLSESQWIKDAHSEKFRPPMAWWVLHAMTKRDLRAIYSFVNHLGQAGEPAPSYLPPDQEPKGPYVLFPQPPK
jgi:hypothetical protein